MELTEKEKLAYECGYRDACLKHGIPFVNVERTKDKIVRVNVEISKQEFEMIPRPYVNEYYKAIAERIVNDLDKELSKTDKKVRDEKEK